MSTYPLPPHDEIRPVPATRGAAPLPEAQHLADLGAALQALGQPYSDTPEVLEAAVRHARSLTRAAGACLRVRQGGQWLTRAAGEAAGLAPEPPLGGARLEAALHVEDAQVDARCDRARAAGHGVRGLLAVPLVLEGESAGVLEVTAHEPGAFDERDARTLEVLALGVGSALVRARVVAEQDAALEALLRTEALFRKAFHHSPIGMALVALDGRLLKVNRALCTLLGLGEAQLLSTTVDALTHADDRGGEEPAVEALLQGEQASYQVEKRFVHRDGHAVWARVSTSLVRDVADQPLHFILQVEDVSDHRAALEGLQQQAQLLDEANDAIFVLELDGTVRYWNRAAESLYGWRAEEARGRRVAELLRAGFPTGRADIDDELHRSGRWEGEVEHERRDGTRLTVSSRWTLRRDAAGRPTAILEINRDVTAQRRARDLLLRKEREFRQLFENLPDAICIHRDGRVIYANGAWARALGVPSPAALLGADYFDLVHPEERGAARAVEEELVRTGVVPGPLERRFGRADGEEVVLEVVPMLLPEFEGGPALLRVGRDVSERRKLQARLLLADRMASVGTLAAGVAHEINNPLAFVMGNLTFVTEELAQVEGQLPAGTLNEATRALEEASQGAERVRHIVKALHTFSRADEEQKRLVDVQRALETSINMATNVIRHKARLVRDYREVPPVLANEARLGQVFVNLLVNAAQALPEGRLAQNEVRVVTRAAGGWVTVEVHDNGSGIAPQHRSRIFDPFFTTKPVGQGTGLGLSICHGIIAAAGGKIEVESEVGRGSCFRVSLPVAEGAEEPAREPAQPAPAAPRRARVLVLDDEPSMGNLVRRLLGGEHDVLALTSAREALDRVARGERFDVVLCDLMMPEMSGVDVHAALGRMAPALAERMVFVTGGAFTPRTQEFLAQVGERTLSKPFDKEGLRARVREVLDRG